MALGIQEASVNIKYLKIIMTMTVKSKPVQEGESWKGTERQAGSLARAGGQACKLRPLLQAPPTGAGFLGS